MRAWEPVGPTIVFVILAFAANDAEMLKELE